MAVVPVVSDLGADLVWSVRQRCRWRADLRHTVDGVATDVSTVTFVAVVTSGPDSTVPLKTFTVSKPAPLDGRFAVTVEAVSADLAPGEFWFSLQWNPGTGAEPLLSGPFVVEPWGVA